MEKCIFNLVTRVITVKSVSEHRGSVILYPTIIICNHQHSCDSTNTSCQCDSAMLFVAGSWLHTRTCLWYQEVIRFPVLSDIGSGHKGVFLIKLKEKTYNCCFIDLSLLLSVRLRANNTRIDQEDSHFERDPVISPALPPFLSQLLVFMAMAVTYRLSSILL